MIRLEFNGKPFDPATFEDRILAEILEDFAEQIRHQVEGIRDPDTGEFPTIVVHANSLDDIQLTVEGSDALIALVKQRLGDDDEEEMQPLKPEATRVRVPKVFVSYASEDRELAKVIAEALMRHGIEAWWDGWEIRTGDSIRQRIEEGLLDCTHFLVLLTPVALTKPWVNQEIDAALVLALEEQVQFMPVRSGLSIDSMPPLLRARHSPEIRDLSSDLQQLVNDIHGITQKPPVGPPPRVVNEARHRGISPAAETLARLFVDRTEHATDDDPQFELTDLAEATGLSHDDLSDALHELRPWINKTEYSGGAFVSANASLFTKFDRHWKHWDPEQDARRIAADLVNDSTFPSVVNEIADRYGWPPRRINPAVTYLVERRCVSASPDMGDHRFQCQWIGRTDATRRFVKSRGAG